MRTTARLVLLVMLAGLALGACDDADLNREGHPNSLAGSGWHVVTINGRPPVSDSEPTAVFAAAEVKGSAGCNSYGATYSYDPSTGGIAFELMRMTAMGCLDPGRSEIEALFVQTIGQVTSASTDPQGRLVLSGQGGEIVLAVGAATSQSDSDRPR
jgi:heat shock protein HslJ